MTKGERNDLMVLVRKREKVMKAAISQQASENLANFERQIATIYECDDDEVWRKAAEEAEAAVRGAQERIAARCDELGIPRECRPFLSISWHGRGRSALNVRRDELRRMAKSRIEATLKAANTQVEQFSLDAQTNILASGLTSEAAKAFLDKMPSASQLMPAPNVMEIKALVDQRPRRDDDYGTPEYLN